MSKSGVSTYILKLPQCCLNAALALFVHPSMQQLNRTEDSGTKDSQGPPRPAPCPPNERPTGAAGSSPAGGGGGGGGWSVGAPYAMLPSGFSTTRPASVGTSM